MKNAKTKALSEKYEKKFKTNPIAKRYREKMERRDAERKEKNHA